MAVIQISPPGPEEDIRSHTKAKGIPFRLDHGWQHLKGTLQWIEHGHITQDKGWEVRRCFPE